MNYVSGVITFVESFSLSLAEVKLIIIGYQIEQEL